VVSLVTAIVEIAGGVLMLLPRTTPVAVLLTSSAMVGALIVHATVTGFGPQTVAAAVLLTLGLLVGWSHLRRPAIGSRGQRVGGDAALDARDWH